MTITEKYFRSIGWEFRLNLDLKAMVWMLPEAEACPQNRKPWKIKLPEITQSFADFKKWVLEKMEGDGFLLAKNAGGMTFFVNPKNNKFFSELPKNNEILSAGVVAATRYFEGKK